MPSIGARVARTLLGRAGVYFQPGFLSPQECRELRDEADASETKPARLRNSQQLDESYLSDGVRKTLVADISKKTKARLETKLGEIRPAFEKNFDVALGELRGTQILVYGKGHYFATHRDNSQDAAAALEHVQGRKVSTILFLNDHAKNSAAAEFSGGGLWIYELLNDPRFGKSGLPIVPEAGLLVAFDSRRMHEVKPVTAGTRYAVVAWFH